MYHKSRGLEDVVSMKERTYWQNDFDCCSTWCDYYIPKCFKCSKVVITESTKNIQKDWETTLITVLADRPADKSQENDFTKMKTSSPPQFFFGIGQENNMLSIPLHKSIPLSLSLSLPRPFTCHADVAAVCLISRRCSLDHTYSTIVFRGRDKRVVRGWK